MWWRGLSRRVVGGVLPVGLLAAGLAGCSAGGGTDLAAGERLPDGQWRGGAFVVSANAPEHLVPGNATTTRDGQILSALFTGLMEYDSKTAEPRNAMAESIHSDDQKLWTIRIKPG